LECGKEFSGGLRCIYISALVELGAKGELFYASHRLVDEEPNGPIAWYAVGCYYFLIHRFDQARSYFRLGLSFKLCPSSLVYSKATALDQYFGPAWLVFGHTFALQGEHDQAMAAYRTAARVLTGWANHFCWDQQFLISFRSHIPLVCIGMELARVNNLQLALQFIQQACCLLPADPLSWNELGLVLYNNKELVFLRRWRLKKILGTQKRLMPSPTP
jgi:anaphase-promoting complex subunit 6